MVREPIWALQPSHHLGTTIALGTLLLQVEFYVRLMNSQHGGT